MYNTLVTCHPMSSQALNWAARERIKLYEVSSLDRESLYEPLVYLSSRLNPPPSKSTFPQINLGRQAYSESLNRSQMINDHFYH